MKSTLTLLLCALAIAGVYSEVNRTQLLQVSRGIVEGISTVKNWGDVTGCISNNEGISNGIADALAVFRLNDSTTVTPAAVKLGQALQKLPAALRSCNSSIQISQTLVQVISSIASLKDYIRIVGNNVNTYQVDLLKNAYAASSEYSQGHLQNFGNKVGQAIAQVFLNGTAKPSPKPDTNATSLYLLVAQGVIEGVDSALKWNTVKQCIKETNDSNANIALAFQLLQSSDSVSLTNGLAALGSALVTIPDSIRDCTGSYTSASNLAKAIAAINNSTAYISQVGKNIVLSGVDIYDEIYSAVQAFKAGAYKEFGTNVGLATSKIFLDNVATAKKTQNFLE